MLPSFFDTLKTLTLTLLLDPNYSGVKAETVILYVTESLHTTVFSLLPQSSLPSFVLSWALRVLRRSLSLLVWAEELYAGVYYCVSLTTCLPVRYWDRYLTAKKTATNRTGQSQDINQLMICRLAQASKLKWGSENSACQLQLLERRSPGPSLPPAGQRTIKTWYFLHANVLKQSDWIVSRLVNCYMSSSRAKWEGYWQFK